MEKDSEKSNKTLNTIIGVGCLVAATGIGIVEAVHMPGIQQEFSNMVKVSNIYDSQCRYADSARVSFTAVTYGMGTAGLPIVVGLSLLYFGAGKLSAARRKPEN